MLRDVVLALLVGYLPGTLIFRLPVADRARRAALAAEERAFWSILLSVVLSSAVVLGLAAAKLYRFDRLLGIDGTVSVLLLAVGRGRLRFGASAQRPGWTALVPVVLVVAGLWTNFFVPPAEYVIGGKDPGVYMNEGIAIGQQGSLIITDEVVRGVPPPYRDLFFPPYHDTGYYSSRFMGFFLLDPGTGAVVGQFPQMYPAWIAIGYGIDGLSGARWILGIWAVLGVLAVYFLGARIAGRPAAAAGAGLLTLNILQVWYARYPNAEMVMQPLVFAGLLASVRGLGDEDRFFGPVAACLLVFGLFAHITGAIAIAAVAVASVLGRLDGQPLRASFGWPLAVGTGLATMYYAVFLPAYFANPVNYVTDLQPLQIGVLSGLALVFIVLWRHADRPVVKIIARTWTPIGLVAAVWLAAIYGLFFRVAGGALAPQDADALRTFSSFYLTPYALGAALVGVLVMTRQPTRVSLPFLLVFATFSILFFYKIRIIPEHFWAARRFLAVVLPGTLLLVGVAAFGDLRVVPGGSLAWLAGRPARTIRYTAGLVLVLFTGWHFFWNTRPILRHVEYAGLIPHVEKLTSTFADEDLVLIESRNASDVHVLALPLAYIYARHVLVFASTVPDKEAFRGFLTWARQHYRRVFFVGGGGTELLSRQMTIQSIGGERFQIPEYESLPNTYPRRASFKEFDYSVYEFRPIHAQADGFDLDVGLADDLYVRRFYAKERDAGGATFRWTRDVSYVSIVRTRPEQQLLTLSMSAAGRPAGIGPASVEVSLNETVLGRVTVGPALESYRFAIPARLAAAIAESEDAARLRIVSSTWNPRLALHSNDDRDLGVRLHHVTLQ